MSLKRPGRGAAIAAGIGALGCCIGIIYVGTLFPVTYRYAADSDKDHVSAFTSVLAAMAAFVAALISAATNFFNALGQRSLEEMKLELQKDLATHQNSLAQTLQKDMIAYKAGLDDAAARRASKSERLVALLRAMSDYKQVLSLFEIRRFGEEDSQLAEEAFRATQKEVALLDDPLRQAIMNFLSEGEIVRGTWRKDPTLDQNRLWIEVGKNFRAAFVAARDAVRTALDSVS